MIALSELKTFLNINTNTNNQYLLDLINVSFKEFETLTNRNYKYNSDITEYVINNDYSDRVYLNTSPIKSVQSIKYLDYSTNEYVDVINYSGDTIENTILIRHNYILITKGYSFDCKDLLIEYSGGYKFVQSSGTVTAGIGITSITGTGTDFLTAGAVNDTLIIDNELLEVNSIVSNTNLTTKTKTKYNHALATVYFSDLPADIKQAVKEIIKYKYNQKNITKIILKDGEQTIPLYELPYNATVIIDNYRKVNV